MSDSDIASLRRRHTFLEEFSDSFIRATTVGDLMKIESTALKMKEMERAKDASDRLASNKSALASTFTLVPEGRDNRISELHMARFLPGAGCSAVRLWLTAREHIGLKNMVPIGSYDMGAIGLAGHVTSKGWLELHNFASAKLSIKQFNINCCGPKEGSKATSEDSSEIVEVAEFKLALRTMRTAFALALPWNLSILALEGFFFQSNFCSADLASVDKKAWYLSKFTDYVLEQNSDRWRDAEPFLTAGELKTTWAAFFSAKPHVQSSSSKSKKEKSSSRSERPYQKTLDPRVAQGICFAWNLGTCLKPTGTCKTAKGRDLKHICDFVPDQNKPSEVCGKDHIRKNFH